jgi:prevent-host-death family protein
MSLASRIKPISYFKANAAEIIKELGEVGEPMIITQNGEAKAVVQDIVSYEKTQETLALLKILALANRDIEEGRYRPAKDVFADLRKRLHARKNTK